MASITRSYLVLLLVLMGVLLGAGTAHAQSSGMPTFVLAYIPMKWSGSLDDFDRAARRQAAFFEHASNIDQYAHVQVQLVHAKLDDVDLQDMDLVPRVIEFGLQNVPADRYVGLTNGNIAPMGYSDIVGYTEGPDSNGLVLEADEDFVSAHELGHTFGLCDEYSYLTWERQNAEWGCPNGYPSNCPTDPTLGCEGGITPHNGRCIMGPAGMPVLREYGADDLAHLNKKFATLFTQAAPPPPPVPSNPVLFNTLGFINQQNSAFQLYTLASNEDAPRLVSKLRGDVFHPTWSPDGTWLAFASTMDGKLEIYKIRADGTDLTRLTNDAARNDAPKWSPDGNWIAFVSERNGNAELTVMKSDGSQVTSLTQNVACDWMPAWAPDGEHLAFVSDRTGSFQIYTMEITLDNMPRAGKVQRVSQSDATDINPAWSPDGKHIAFASNRDGTLAIYVMDADGANVQRVTQGLAAAWSPTWLKQPSWLAFQSARANGVQIYAVNLSDGSEQPLVVTAGENGDAEAQ